MKNRVRGFNLDRTDDRRGNHRSARGRRGAHVFGLHARYSARRRRIRGRCVEDVNLAVRSTQRNHHAATCGIPGDNGVPEDVGVDEFNYVVSVNPVAMPLLPLPRLPCMAVVIHSL